MSASGQKQTYAVHQPMSPLLSIAIAKAGSRKWPGPLCLRKRIYAVQEAMSAKGQLRTFRYSLDRFVGAGMSELATASDTLSSPSERGRTDAGLGL